MVIWLAVAAGLIALAGLVLGVLVVCGRRAEVRAIAGFVPDCVVLFGRLLRDPRLRRRDRLPVAMLLGYLALPFDLVPDIVPVAGQLDDAILAAVVLRRLARRAGPGLISEHWPGPERSLAVLLRLVGVPAHG